MNPVTRTRATMDLPVIDWDHHQGRVVFTDMRSDRRSFSDTAAVVLDLHSDRSPDALLDTLRRFVPAANVWMEPSPGAVHAEFGAEGDGHATRWWARTDRQPDGRTRLRVVVATTTVGRFATQYRSVIARLTLLCTELGALADLRAELDRLVIRTGATAPDTGQTGTGR